MQWLQIANQSNEDDLNNVRRETSRCFKKNYFKGKTNEFEAKSNNKIISEFCRGFNEFKDYKPRINIAKDQTGDLVDDSRCTFNR